MKKVIATMMTVLLIGALFISCSQQVQEDRLGSVDISFQESRTLDVTVTSDIKPVSDLVWYYTAIKTSGLYATGQKTTLTKIGVGLVSGTKLDDFSTGGWKFSFYGFNSESESSDTENAVYYAKDIEITVVAEQSNPVNIALSVGKIGKGKVVFTDLSVDLSNLILRTGGTLTLNIKQNNVQKATFTSDEVDGPASYSLKSGEATAVILDGIDPGTYTYIFSVVYTLGNESVEVAEEEWQVTVNNGTVVTFEGDVLKTNELADVVIGEVTGETEAEAVIEPTSLSEAKSYTVEISPASVSDPDSVARTTVSFPENVLDSVITADAGQILTSSKVTIDVTDTVEASTKFIVVGESSSAFAGINLDLYKTVTTTGTEEESTTSKIDNPSFANPVTVETYIAKGLTGVTVEYQANAGDEHTSHPVASTDPDKIAEKQADVYATDAAMGDKLGYSQQSGLLRFTTTHFSEFAVGADQYVYDKTTNTAYKLYEEEDENKGKLLNAAGEVVDAVATNDYVLLDSSKANLVHDAIDVFNADYNWTVIYGAGDSRGRVDHDLIVGAGSKVDPYIISNGAQWTNLISSYDEEYLANWYGECDGAMYVILAGDIDMSGYDLSSYITYPYNLHLDGNGHKLSNLSTTIWGYYGYYYKKCEIKNITIEDSYAKYSIFGYGPGEYVNTSVYFTDVKIKNSEANGGLFMYYTGASAITFEDCVVEGSLVHGPSNMAGGGFVGNGQGITIDKCKFGGSIVAESGNIVGGFVGQGKAIITNSEITEGSVIRSIAANGKVAAYDGQGGGERDGDNNTFKGILSCDVENNAKKQNSGATWEQYVGLSVSDFALADDGTISYVGATPIPFAKITISESLFQRSEYYKNGDSGQEGKNAYILGGFSCYWEDLIKVDVTSSTLYKVDKVNAIVNVVSENENNYSDRIAFATTVVPEVGWTKYNSYLDRENGILYYDGRDSRSDRCHFIGQSADVTDASTGELRKVDNPYGDFYIVIKAYDQNNGIVGSVTLSYRVNFK